MVSRFEKQVSSEVPALLAKLLEIPENRISIRKGKKEPATDSRAPADLPISLPLKARE
jgi:hypothetical protein